MSKLEHFVLKLIPGLWAGAGIAFLPAAAIRREIDEGRLVTVLNQYVICGAALYLLHSGGRFLAPKVRVFRDFILDASR